MCHDSREKRNWLDYHQLITSIVSELPDNTKDLILVLRFQAKKAIWPSQYQGRKSPKKSQDWILKEIYPPKHEGQVTEFTAVLNRGGLGFGQGHRDLELEKEGPRRSGCQMWVGKHLGKGGGVSPQFWARWWTAHLSRAGAYLRLSTLYSPDREC